MKKLLNASEAAFLAGITVPTMNYWYAWARYNPRHELAKLLPKYQTIGNKNTRYWREEDVYRLVEFKSKIPHGRNGILGDITQKYVRKPKEDKKNGAKKETGIK